MLRKGNPLCVYLLGWLQQGQAATYVVAAPVLPAAQLHHTQHFPYSRTLCRRKTSASLPDEGVLASIWTLVTASWVAKQ